MSKQAFNLRSSALSNLGVDGSTLSQSGSFSLILSTSANTEVIFPSGVITVADLDSAQTFTGSKTFTGQFSVLSGPNSQSYSTTDSGFISISSAVTGNIDNMTIGATTPANGYFTNISTSTGNILTSGAVGSIFDTTALTLNLGGTATTIREGYIGDLSSVHNIATGSVGSGQTKTLNIGTTGTPGSSINIDVGTYGDFSLINIGSNGNASSINIGTNCISSAITIGSQTGLIDLRSDDLVYSGLVATSSTSALQVPVGSSLQRDSNSFLNGFIRYNTTKNEYESFNSAGFKTTDAGWSYIGGYRYIQSTTNITASIFDKIACNVISNGFTVTLPSVIANGDWVEIIVNKGDAAINNIIVNGNGNNIDGSSTFNISINKTAFIFIFDGTQWVLSDTASSSTTTISTIQGGVVYGASNTSYGTTAAGTPGQILKSNGTAAPSFSTPSISLVRTDFSATAGQTSFSVSYAPNAILVYYNGILLRPVDYTATNGTTIVLAQAAELNDEISVVEYRLSLS